MFVTGSKVKVTGVKCDKTVTDCLSNNFPKWVSFYTFVHFILNWLIQLNKSSVTKKAVRGCNGLRTSLVTGYLTILKVVYLNVTLRNLYYEFIRGLFSVVQESLIFTMVLDLLLLQLVWGRGYFFYLKWLEEKYILLSTWLVLTFKLYRLTLRNFKEKHKAGLRHNPLLPLALTSGFGCGGSGNLKVVVHFSCFNLTLWWAGAV